jgi:hypothetical protein
LGFSFGELASLFQRPRTTVQGQIQKARVEGKLEKKPLPADVPDPDEISVDEYLKIMENKVYRLVMSDEVETISVEKIRSLTAMISELRRVLKDESIASGELCRAMIDFLISDFFPRLHRAFELKGLSAEVGLVKECFFEVLKEIKNQVIKKVFPKVLEGSPFGQDEFDKTIEKAKARGHWKPKEKTLPSAYPTERGRG